MELEVGVGGAVGGVGPIERGDVAGRVGVGIGGARDELGGGGPIGREALVELQANQGFLIELPSLGMLVDASIFPVLDSAGAAPLLIVPRSGWSLGIRSRKDFSGG